jgi:FMN reductase
VLAWCADRLEQRGITTDALHVRDLDAADLLHANARGASIQDGIARVAAADGIIIATPVYKAAYTGVLKAFLDLLPGGALAGKVVLPIASGAGPAHALVVDYALRPVLAALNASHILGGVYLLDSQFDHVDGIITRFNADEAETRLAEAVHGFATALARQAYSPES